MSQERYSSCNGGNKSVQFSRFIKISFTYPGDEYDRSALEPAKLTFSEASELMQLRIDWKQEMNRRIEQQQLLQQQQQQLHDSDDIYSSSDDDAHILMSRSPRSGQLSPALSRQGLTGSAGSGSEDEYDQVGLGHPSFSKKSLGGSVSMHRHSELHQSKESMACLA